MSSSKAKIALAASGTVTLSSVLMQVPTIVGYRLTPGNELFLECLLITEPCLSC